MILDTKWLPFLLSVFITVAAVSAGYGSLGWRVTQAEGDIDDIQSDQKNMVTDEKMKLTLEPIKQDIRYTAETVKDIKASQARQEEINWKILKQLEHLGASNTTADAPHVGGRALMRSTRDNNLAEEFP